MTQSLRNPPSAWMNSNQIRLLSAETLWQSLPERQLLIKMLTACRRASTQTRLLLFIAQVPSILTLSQYRNSETVSVNKWRSQRNQRGLQALKDWIEDGSINYSSHRIWSRKTWRLAKSSIKSQAELSQTKIINSNKANLPTGSKTNAAFISLDRTASLVMNKREVLRRGNIWWRSSLIG